MKRFHVGLAVVLAVQVGLAFLTWSRELPTGDSSEVTRSALGLTAADIVLVRMEQPAVGKQGASKVLELERDGDQWVLASADGYPAKGSPAGLVAEKLASLELTGPIATNAANHDALGVGAVHFARRVTVVSRTGEKTTLLFGDGPRATSHVRVDGADDVWAVPGFSVAQLSMDPRYYVEPVFVSIERSVLKTIEITGPSGPLSFSAGEQGWTLAQLAEEKVVDAAALGALVNAASRSIVLEPVGRFDAAHAHGLDNGVSVSLTWGGETPGTIEYTLGDRSDEGHVFAKRGDSEFVVVLPAPVGEALIGKTPADFAAAPAAP